MKVGSKPYKNKGDRVGDIKPKALHKIQKDIENNNLGKARDRLHGLISTYPNALQLRKQLGDIYYQLQDPAMAGRYRYLEEEKTAEMSEACRLFEKSMGNDTYHIRRALKYKGDTENMKALTFLNPKEKNIQAVIVKEEKETLGEKLLLPGCVVLIISIVLFSLLGIYTFFNWLF